MAEKTKSDYEWKPEDDPDPRYNMNERMVTVTMPEGMWEDIISDAKYATGSGEQTLAILAQGGGDWSGYMNEFLIEMYRRVAVRIGQVDKGEHGSVEYQRY